MAAFKGCAKARMLEILLCLSVMLERSPDSGHSIKNLCVTTCAYVKIGVRVYR